MPQFFGFLTPPQPVPLSRELSCGSVRIVPRRRETVGADWDYLEAHHLLRPGRDIANAWTSGVTAQVVIDATDMAAAKTRLRRLRSLMRVAGLYPAWIPFVSTHSIDDFSGLSEKVRLDDPRYKRRLAIVEKREPVLVEFVDMGLGAAPYDSEDLTPQLLERVAAWEPLWDQLIVTHPEVRVLDQVLQVAPEIDPIEQATLFVWSTLESLFPSVQTEVSYRVSLHLTQLLRPDDRVTSYKQIRRMYNTRSRIAHGSPLKMADARTAWADSWLLLRQVASAILDREVLPTEQELLEELLG